jgi:mRNA-degrading endonuclease RelE of RelBE toxin-antitoxin system
MPKIELTEEFLRQYAGLPKEIQEKVKKAVRLLAQDPRYPSLQSKPIQGAVGIYEARVDRNYRLTYDEGVYDRLILRIASKRDEAS